MYLFNNIKIKNIEIESDFILDEDEKWEDSTNSQGENANPRKLTVEVMNQMPNQNQCFESLYSQMPEQIYRISFYKELFWLLKHMTLDEIMPSFNSQVLWPLDRKKSELNNMAIQLYYTSLDEEAEINVMYKNSNNTTASWVSKNFYVVTKAKETFGNNNKNPVLVGDFGIKVKVKRKTYTWWMNVNMITQAAYLSKIIASPF